MSSPSVSTTTALMRSGPARRAHRVEALDGGVVDRGAAVGEEVLHGRAQLDASASLNGATGMQRLDAVVEDREPDAVLLPDLLEEAPRGPAWRARGGSRRPSSPDVSTTSSTFAGLRSSRHARRIAVEHARLGQAEHPLGWAGSTPFSFETGATGSCVEVGRAEARARRQLRRDLVGEELAGSARAPWRCGGADPGAVEHDERVVGVEGALGRIERHEPRLRAAVAVEVEQRDLLHRHGRRVARALAAHLVGDEERGVAVVHDRALDVAHDRRARRSARRPPPSGPPSCRWRRSTRRRPPRARRSRSPGWCARA